ncbi:14 kDa phosphohistidine phosphatase isoform X1 [Columba livia]|uniref:14 kDa phosphohistidine phosphatase isoform X1 n=1 Tax=Columba livia TaxID=8932 RepID=UPI0031BBA52A
MAAAAEALSRVPDVEIDGDGVFNRHLRADGAGAGAAGPGLRVPGGRPPLPPPPGAEDPRLRVLGAPGGHCPHAELCTPSHCHRGTGTNRRLRGDLINVYKYIKGLWPSGPLCDYGEAESQVSGLRGHLGR